MSSPKRTEQGSVSSPDHDGDNAQDSLKIKDEPIDPSYENEKAPGTPSISGNNSNSNSNSNSRSSSPCPPVHFGNMSPSQGRDSASSGPPTPLNDGLLSSSSIRTHVQISNSGKKTDTVQNIVEGLLKKNATLLAMSDAESLRPLRRQKTQEFNNGKKDFSPSAVFPVSSTSQARLVQHEGRKMTQSNKPMLLRPKSPTKKCESVLRDKSQLSYSLMESALGDENIEKIFKVQQHELVCAVSSKPYIFDRVNNERKLVASLDNNYFWCNFCSFSSSNKSLITNHIMDHRFCCKFCPYESFCRSDVLRHMGKMHEEFEMAINLSYCTFLSDYIRCKNRAEGKENNEPTVDNDEDVGEIDNDTIKTYHEENLKRKREAEENQEFVPSGKWAKMDSPDDSASNGTRQGKSRKSQNPRRHPQVNEKDYDTFEMEVEEIDESENGGETHSERILYPSSSQENSSDHRNPSMGSHMQLIPSLQDEGPHGYTATHVSRPTPPQIRAGRPPTYMGNNRGGNNRGTQRTASASSLYWSCGYCDFQSSSQAEIKEHSNRTHPGKPHRYVALIKNMTPDSIINKNANKYGHNASHNLRNTSPSLRNTSPAFKPSPSFSSVKLDNVANRFDSSGAGMSEDVVNLSNNADDSTLKVKIGTPRGPKKDNTTYKCYHCSYTAKRHSSMKSHIYYKHRGKGLLAVDEDTSTGGQVFFCARDDCTFKSTSPTSYLNHVEQCTPWHKPELADVEVEPHIRECLQQTVTFAEMALDKVDIRNTVLREGPVYDSGQPPDVIVSNKDKTYKAESNLPNSFSGMQDIASDLNDLKSCGKYTLVGEDCISEEGPHDIGGEKPHENYPDVYHEEELTEAVNEKNSKHDDAIGSFSKFEALNMSSPCESDDSLNDQELENNISINDTKEVSGADLEDKNFDNDKKSNLSSSLKLTFRIVDGATTVSSMTDNDEIIQNESELSNTDITELEDSSIDKSEQFSKKLEEELIDSSSDSESDFSSVCNPESDRETISIGNSEYKHNFVEARSSAIETSLRGFVERPEEKLLLSCVPARSAAVKALTKMKPVLDDEVEDKEDSDQYSVGKKMTFAKPEDVSDKSHPLLLPSRNACYDCYYCHSLGASPLRIVKSHLANKHPVELPIVSNLKFKYWKKKSSFYVCPFSSCNKLFSAYDDLTSHRSTHPSMSLNSCNINKDPNSYQGCSIRKLLSFSSSVLHVPLEAENIPDCKVLLKPLSESELFETMQNTSSLHKALSTRVDEGRYECLYCTEHYSHTTLSGMKHHYAAEHSGQLLVLRDVEAKKEKQTSRIYVCEESDCEFTSLSRADLETHAKCHKSNCTFVYECAACGWYSSSFWTAKDHLIKEHSIHDSAYLIHMQLSVDENGQTSKKVLRSM